MIYEICKIKWCKLVNDILRKVDLPWKETLMALEQELDEALLEGLDHRQPEKPSLMRNALAVDDFDQIHRNESKSYSRLKASVSDVLED